MLCVSMLFIVILSYYFFFFKQKTAYEMRISDWSSDVCSSDLTRVLPWRGVNHEQADRSQESRFQRCRQLADAGKGRCRHDHRLACSVAGLVSGDRKSVV